MMKKKMLDQFREFWRKLCTVSVVQLYMYMEELMFYYCGITCGQYALFFVIIIIYIIMYIHAFVLFRNDATLFYY